LAKRIKLLLEFYPSFRDTCESEIVFTGVIFKKNVMNMGFTPKKYAMLLADGVWLNRTNYVDLWEYNIEIKDKVANLAVGSYVEIRDKLNKLEASCRPSSQEEIILSGISSLPEKRTRLICSREGIYILTALKLYKLRHGSYPETLDKLAPEIIPAVPLNPFSDKPFIYRVDKDGELFLYSVGVDLQDDNADPKKDVVISPKAAK